jgi:hypothetical protein
MVHVSTYNAHMSVNAHLVLEPFNHSTNTLGSRPNFGVVEPILILEVHANSLSILYSYQVDRMQMPNLRWQE